MSVRIAMILAMTPCSAPAESVVALRTLPARSEITAEDLTLVDADIPGALGSLEDAVGLEARVTIYAGRAVRLQDLQPKALVERNQLVMLAFDSGPLSIRAEGRALQRGAEGDWIRVINLASKSTVVGRVESDGSIQVGGGS